MGDLGLTPELGGSLGEAKDYPLQYSDLENSRTAQSIGSQSWTQLSDFHLVLLEEGRRLSLLKGSVQKHRKSSVICN